ncbi:oligosaccharide flippase family protein [Sphingomonas sp.]|uniref:oligosaccharide flippase family protein n=1 Tax=Sphingomonas sp. TaxID=28214 RepID=UPI003CC698E6
MSIRKSLAWSYGSQAFTLVLNFISSVVLARLLSPREMGTFAFAVAVTGVLAVFTQLNLVSYIVREGELDKNDVRSVFTLNAAMNVLLTVLVIAIAAVERFVLDEPQIALILLVGSVLPLLQIFEFIPVALYARELNYAAMSQVGIYRTVINVAVILACAYGGLGALSPTLGPVVATVFTATYYTAARWQDVIFRPTRRGFRPVLVFGLQMLSIGGVAQIAQRASDIVLGRLLGLAALGLYSRASNLANLMWTSVYGQATGAVFSRMAEDLRRKDTLHETYLLSMKMITAIMWPVMLGVAVLARPLVFRLYGERWLPAAVPLALLMIGQFVALGYGMAWELFVLRRETGRQARFELFRAVVGLAMFSVGCLYSITAAAIGRVGEAIVGYLLYRPQVDRLAGVEQGELERVFAESLLLAAAAITPAFVIMAWSGWAADAPLPRVIAGIVLGVGGWLGVLAARDHPLLAEMRLVWSKARVLMGSR